MDVANTAGRGAPGADLVVENDRVTSLYLAHECADTIVDGVSAGPAHVNAQWLPVAGPDEVREIPEFEGAPVLPTAYWTSVVHETDNPTLQELATAAGIDMTLADSTTFVPYIDVVNVDGFETEALGSIRVANVPGGILLDADGPNEPIGGVPGEPGLAFTTTFDSQILTTAD